MQILVLKVLAVIGDLYNGSDWILRQTAAIITKAIGG